MTCEFCGQALSGLVAGLVSLVSFIAVPVAQILLATFKILFERLERVFVKRSS